MLIEISSRFHFFSSSLTAFAPFLTSRWFPIRPLSEEEYEERMAKQGRRQPHARASTPKDEPKPSDENSS
jgi:hypothetical protein